MITTKIEVPKHLKEYLTGKFCYTQDIPVRLPDNSDLYHILYDLLERRPVNVPVDRGNLELCIPDRSIGKAPETYNYLGIRSQMIFCRKIDLMLWAEVHDFLDEQKHRYGIEYINGVHTFMMKYGICSITEDAFIKNYYRWRAKVRRKENKRGYNRSKISPGKCS